MIFDGINKALLGVRCDEVAKAMVVTLTKDLVGVTWVELNRF